MAQATDEKRRLQEQFLQKTAGRESIATLREEMQKIMERSAGIYRTGDSLSGAAASFSELQERFRDIRLDDHGRIFNTELISALELSCMLDVAETMAQCALIATESRGAHQRTDFPNETMRSFWRTLSCFASGRSDPHGVRCR